MKTGIVILNYNNFDDTINCVKSVDKFCLNEELTIAIVDNGSKNNSCHEISSFLNHSSKEYEVLEANNSFKPPQKQVTLIKSDENLGYAKGNNLGIQFLIQQNVEYILILNNDILLTDNLIEPLRDALVKNPEIGLISPILLNINNEIDHNCCRINPTEKILILESLKFLNIKIITKYLERKYLFKTNPDLIHQKIVNCDIISGACMMAKTNTWKRLKGFDENTFLYYEENILFEKLAMMNLNMSILNSTSAIHLGAKSTKKIVNAKILSIELESLIYYMKSFRSLSTLSIILIKAIRLFQIFILRIYNQLKKQN